MTLAHYCDTWAGSGYSSEAILGNSCGYEIGGSMNRGLKTSSTFYIKNPSNPSQFVQEWAESYGYDSALDDLTSANYGDGQANANPTWTYDAAGNRNDATCDNLNRATSIGGVSRTYDILGNTLTKGSTTSMGWDALNRMTSFASSSTSASYTYRADGMRTKKVVGSTSTRFAYDGQMPIETWDGTTVTRQALGARGIDWSQATTSSGATVSYPIYDGHGNNVATLFKSGSSYSLSGRRSYGAWGEIRQGATSGGAISRYCASLGHLVDDESSLIYMRARYYDPTAARFTAQDPARESLNFYVYCDNDPTSLSDMSGHVGFKDWNDGGKKFFELLKALGVPTAFFAIPAVASIIVKLCFDLTKYAQLGEVASGIMQIGLGTSVCNPLVGAGMLIGGGILLGVISVVAFFEMYNAALAIFLLTSDFSECVGNEAAEMIANR